MQYTTTTDKFLNGKIKLMQYANGYKSGMDAVLLASIVKAKAGHNILDLGSGVGAIALCLLSRLKNINVHALEKNHLFFNLLQQNSSLNANVIQSNCNTFTLHNGNLLNYNFNLQFNAIVCNPPYFSASSTQSQSAYAHIRDCANILQDATLLDFINFMVKNLKNNGQIYIIYPSHSLHYLLNLLNPKHWGCINIYPIHSGNALNSISKRFMLVATKNSKSPSVLHSGLTVYNGSNSYSNHATDILYNGNSFYNYIGY